MDTVTVTNLDVDVDVDEAAKTASQLHNYLICSQSWYSYCFRIAIGHAHKFFGARP